MPMRRFFWLILLFVVSPLFGESVSVAVRETQLRSTPAFLGRVIEVLSYGDLLEVVSEQGAWKRVTTKDGAEGWVHNSALSEKRIVLNAADSDVETGASSGEVALAGRGFNEQVENQYKEETGLDFSKVDEIEGYGLPPEELIAFIEEGELKSPEGGEQ